jgi:hypothetical protein
MEASVVGFIRSKLQKELTAIKPLDCWCIIQGSV